MRCLVFDGTLAVTDRPRPVPVPGEALLRVALSGICNTDLDRALAAMADGTIDPRPLISRTFPLDAAREAIEYAMEPQVLKVLLAPPAGRDPGPT
jgi:threonine dehydrogenase-like Zn-dependent dehydrogenase